MEKFTLLQTTLYAKGWYKEYNNKRTIWDDVKITLTADGYNGNYMTNDDVLRIILHQCQRLDLICFKDLCQIISGISKEFCWKCGYFTKDNFRFASKKENESFPEYNYYESVLRYCLSGLAMTDATDLGIDKFPEPDYKNCLPRKNGIGKKDLSLFK